MEHYKRINACTLKAWNNYISSFHSREEKEMWAYLYILFATEREMVVRMI